MKKILLIKHGKKSYEALRQLLETDTYTLFSSATEAETTTLLKKEKFDLVVLHPKNVSTTFNPIQWLQDHSSNTKVIFTTEDENVTGYSNVISSVSYPLTAASLAEFIKTNLGENGFFGVLNDISLKDYIQLICMRKATKAIRVIQQNEKGLIIVHDGNILYAAQDNLLGVDAFYRIMSWKSGSFREVKVNELPPSNIDKDYRYLLLEANDGKTQNTDTQTVPEQNPENPGTPTATINDKNQFPQSSQNQDAVNRYRNIGKNPTQTSHDHQKKGFLFGRKRPLIGLIGLAGLLSLLIAIVITLTFNLFEESSPTAYANLDIPSTAPSKDKIAAVQPKADNGESQNNSVPSDSMESHPASNKPVPLREETILRLHGSNTVGAELAPALIAEYLTVGLGAKKVERARGENENEMYLKGLFNDHIKVVEIHAHGSSTGFKDMAADKCDIAMSSRKIKEKEILALQRFGEMTAGTNEHIIALDGIAVVVNKSNKIEKLDTQQLADIFSGRVGNWEENGGISGDINIYARDDNSGTYDTFNSIILGKENALKPEAKRFESNPELSDQVADDPNGIGFTSLPNIQNAKAIAVAEAGAKAIYPNFFTVATEDYPISRRLYLYTAANPANPHIRTFVEFAHSVQGQEVVNRIGLVDMNVRSFYAEKTDTSQLKNPELIRDYLNATDNGQRLSLNFRFTSEKTTLDNRSIRDLDRIVDFLKDKLDRKIILAGFADNSGDYAFNLNLARARAETVAEQMRARGVFIDRIFSCGEELPVATNSSSSGRLKNRRVEVWLK